MWTTYCLPHKLNTVQCNLCDVQWTPLTVLRQSVHIQHMTLQLSIMLQIYCFQSKQFMLKHTHTHTHTHTQTINQQAYRLYSVVCLQEI